MWSAARATAFVFAVILACAHLDHDPTNNRATNLRALCQACHLRHDRADNLERAALTRFLKRLLRQPTLFISTQGTLMPQESAPFLLVILGEYPCLLCQRPLTQADADANAVLGFGLGERMHFACLRHFFAEPQARSGHVGISSQPGGSGAPDGGGFRQGQTA